MDKIFRGETKFERNKREKENKAAGKGIESNVKGESEREARNYSLCSNSSICRLQQAMLNWSKELFSA